MRSEQFLPARAVDLIQKLRDAPRFEGDFPDFAAAAQASTGYNAPAIANEAANSVTNEWPMMVSAREQQTLAAFAPILNGAALRVLDVGGANGHAFNLLRQMTSQALDWTVLETPEMVKACRNGQGPRYVEQLPNETFDVIHASGVLQYLPDPFWSLANFAQRARWLILNRVPLWTRRRITVQRTPIASYPAWFFSRNEILDRLAALGSLRMQWTVPQDAPLLDGRRVTYYGFVVKRHTA